MKATIVNRRTWVRYPCDIETSCQPIVNFQGKQWAGTVSNLSEGGIAVLLPRRFEPGTALSIEVQEREGSATRTLIARVVRVKRQADGNWLLGCAFVQPLGEDDVEALL